MTKPQDRCEEISIKFSAIHINIHNSLLNVKIYDRPRADVINSGSLEVGPELGDSNVAYWIK